MKKFKIINDPIYGFISFPSKLINDLIDHPYFQRLRRIKQLGLTDLVYPGAIHSRFHHAIGATYLMSQALYTLKNKGHKISKEEFEAALTAILLHDIGHGPFSHALEYSIMDDVDHEYISLALMEELNQQFNGKLELAIRIFSDRYERPFFHQLVSGQLDVDRLDYLNRDCYFTGVTEGQVSFDRIVKMLNLHDDKLVVEEKGIYSIENFLNARRLMYWQVYLHKTVISAEFMMMKILERARYLTKNGEKLYLPASLERFMMHNIDREDFKQNKNTIRAFISLDDNDVVYSLKQWQYAGDPVLSLLCEHILNRKLFQIRLSGQPFDQNIVQKIKREVAGQMGLASEGVDYLVITDSLSNSAYLPKEKNINILSKNGKVIDVANATDLPNITAMSTPVHKYFVCWPKEIKVRWSLN